MSDPKYLKPENFDFCLSHAIEECGEFLAAAGKTQRWGLESVNPTLPPDQREHNGRWLLRELDDVEGALQRLRVRLSAAGYESQTHDILEDFKAHEFKNFHRALCERFGYGHDPVDWKRDQISLIEHIASACNPQGKL